MIDRALMSPRDTYWFLAGAASGLMVGALGIYFLMSPPAGGTGTASANANPSPSTAAAGPAPTNNTPDLLMPGDQWPTVAEVESTGAGTSGKNGSPSAGSLDEVTRKLAQRLATKGGTDDEWRLLAQSYEYMGRTNDARAARMHVAAGETNATTNADTASTNATPQQRASAAAPGSRISGTVRIAPKLAASAPAGMTLFVYALDPASPGPPLAVLRLRVERWPVSFVLDDADAMIPGRNLSGSKRIQLEARISPTGEALPHPGDLVGKLENVDPHTTQPVDISIDSKIT